MTSDKSGSGSSDGKNEASQNMAIMVFAVRVASAALAFFSQVLLARWMGNFEYGIFVAVWAGVVICSTLTTLGLPPATTRFVAEYREEKKNSLVWGVIHGSTWLAFASSTIAASIAALLLYLFPEAVTNYFVMPIFLAALCLPALGVEGVNDGIGRTFNWLGVTFLPTFIIRPLGILMIMGVAILIGYEPTAVTAMWSAVISTYITSIGQYTVLISKLHKTLKPEKPKLMLKYWLMVALPIFLVESFYVLLTQVDVVFVSWLMDPESTAVYFAATKILALVHFVYFAVRAAVAHRYVEYNVAGDTYAYQQFVQKTVAWTFWPSLALAICMCLLGKYFLMLFGPDFVSGWPILWVLAIGIIIRASIGPAESLLVMSGRQNVCAIVYAGAFMLNVVLNLTLIPQFGLIGAALATAIALVFESVILYTIARVKLDIHAFIIPRQMRTTAEAKG
ncbi:MAG: flippase [Pseudomonadota bacterium]